LTTASYSRVNGGWSWIF